MFYPICASNAPIGCAFSILARGGIGGIKVGDWLWTLEGELVARDVGDWSRDGLLGKLGIEIGDWFGENFSEEGEIRGWFCGEKLGKGHKREILWKKKFPLRG